MTDSIKIESATNWLSYADQQDFDTTWNNSSEIFQSAVDLNDWRQQLKSARSPLGAVISRRIEAVDALETPPGAPDGNYTKLLFDSSFEKKKTAKETITLIEENDGQWRIAGYFIK